MILQALQLYDSILGFASVRKCDPACTRPMTCLVVVVEGQTQDLACWHQNLSCVGLLGSKNVRIGADVSIFAWLKDRSWLAVHTNSFFVLSSGWSGTISEAIESMLLADSWLASPTNEQRSLWVAGVRNLDMASVIAPSTWYPFSDRLNPAKVTSTCVNWHLFVLSVIPLLAQCCRNLRAWSL